MTKDLNRLSAEVVMGWVWSDEYEMWCDGSERDAEGRLTYANPDELDWINDDPDELGHQAPWNPLHDLNQCFQVVEKMESEGWYFYCEPEPNYTFPGHKKGIIIYEIGFYHLKKQSIQEKPYRGYCISEKITGEAILTAALKAKGVCLEV